MRVARLAPLVLVALLGFTPPASACPMDKVGAGTVSNVITAVGNLLGLTSGSLTSSEAPSVTGAPPSTSTTPSAFATNTASPTGASNAAAATGAPGLTIAAVAAGGGGGGGGLGGLSSGGFGSAGGGGAPQNPSPPLLVVAGSGTDSGTAFIAEGVTATGHTSGVGFAGAAADTDAAPLTNGVALASASNKNTADEVLRVAMASATADYVTGDASVGFGDPSVLGMLPTEHGWTILTGLVGIGVAAAGWAVRAFMV